MLVEEALHTKFRKEKGPFIQAFISKQKDGENTAPHIANEVNQIVKGSQIELYNAED